MEMVRKGRRPTNERAFRKIRDAGKMEVVITRKEWLLATPPGAYIIRRNIGGEYSVRSLADGSGWLVKKV